MKRHFLCIKPHSLCVWPCFLLALCLLTTSACRKQNQASIVSPITLRQAAASGIDPASAEKEKSPVPVVTVANKIPLDDLASKAMIRRDRYGVPHILAETESAAAYAHGYATAEDHGAELARLFLRARGALASIFGEQYFEEDVRTRTLGIYETALTRFDEIPPYMQQILAAYAAGYNSFLLHHRSDFPDWATQVDAVDVLANCRAVLLLDFALNLTGWGQKTHTGSASTMWAVGRPLSKSGNAMLLANPHVLWGGGTVFHEVHLTVPGVINISGGTFIGMPVVSMGFNGHLGWAHTYNRVDSDDIYELTLDPDRTRYSYDGNWLPLRPRTITVEVLKGNSIETRTSVVQMSHYGPVIQNAGEKAYAFKSANLSDVNFLTQYNAMGKATTLRSFQDALNMQQLPLFNLAYADREGNIWYLFNGRIPIRPSGYNWSGIVPGNTSKTEWFAVRPISELPQLLNPVTGYIQNCNDGPWYTNLEQRIDPASYAGYLEKMESLDWRSQASLRFLGSVRELTLDQLMAKKVDSEILIAQRLKKELLTLIRAQNNKEWLEAAKLLEEWDNHADVDSLGAVLFFSWWAEYYKLTPTRQFNTPWSSADPIATPVGISEKGKAIEGFGKAVASVLQRYGRLDVAWGETHRLRRGNLDLPLGGTPLTLRNVMYRMGADGKLEAMGGDSFVMAVEFTQTEPRAFTVLAHSQSANPKSPHYNDQAALYANGQYKRSWYTETSIAENLSRQYRPEH